MVRLLAGLLRRLAPACAGLRRLAPACAGLRRLAPACAGLRRLAPACAGLRRSIETILSFMIIQQYGGKSNGFWGISVIYFWRMYGKNPVSFWDFGRFGCIPSVTPKAVGGKGISVICFWRMDGEKSVSFWDFGRFFWRGDLYQVSGQW